jgi:hypothetical protein
MAAQQRVISVRKTLPAVMFTKRSSRGRKLEVFGQVAGGMELMAATIGSHIAPESLRLMLLAYGMDHAYRVISLEEISQSVPHVRRDDIRNGLEHLAQEGLVTRFSGRYCFNKAIPIELRQSIEKLITPSGTIRKRTN